MPDALPVHKPEVAFTREIAVMQCAGFWDPSAVLCIRFVSLKRVHCFVLSYVFSVAACSRKALPHPAHMCRPSPAHVCQIVRIAVLRRYVSRDRNIVQFYGACVQTNSLLLVIELMEVKVDTLRSVLLLQQEASCWQRALCETTLLQAYPSCRCFSSLPHAISPSIEGITAALRTVSFPWSPSPC
jgi:hypothetical protein